VAKKKSKRRGWSGAPASRPTGAARPGAAPRTTTGAGTSAAAGGAASGDGATGTTGMTGTTGTTTSSATTKPAGKPLASGSATKSSPATASQQTLSNRAARKEEARRQREAIRRKEARRKAMRRWGTIAAIVVVAGAVIALIVLNSGPKELKRVDPHDLAGIQTTPAPWAPETADLSERLDQMGLPPLGGESTDYHIHQNLLVYIDGVRQPIPTGVGSLGTNQLAEIHTHTGSGTVHVEAAANRAFTLQDVFNIWGVLFTKNQLGSYKNTSDKQIRIFVDGKEVSGDPSKVALDDEQVIVVTYGTESELPDPMPSKFVYEQDPATAGGTTTGGTTTGGATTGGATTGGGTTTGGTTTGGGSTTPGTTGATTAPATTG
jgi:hypothetical protein